LPTSGKRTNVDKRSGLPPTVWILTSQQMNNKFLINKIVRSQPRSRKKVTEWQFKCHLVRSLSPQCSLLCTRIGAVYSVLVFAGFSAAEVLVASMTVSILLILLY
jgi:hypothetical protein